MVRLMTVLRPIENSYSVVSDKRENLLEKLCQIDIELHTNSGLSRRGAEPLNHFGNTALRAETASNELPLPWRKR